MQYWGMTRVRSIQRYSSGDEYYLRVVRGRKHQKIANPTPSSLLPSPNERPRDSRKVRERSRMLRENTPNDLKDKAFSAIRERFTEIAESENPGEVTGGKAKQTGRAILRASVMHHGI